MIRALYTAATGMQAQEANLDVIANNLANVNTTGFKKSAAQFQDLLYQTQLEPGSPTSQNSQSPSGIEVGLGTKEVSTQKDFRQGDLTSTGNPLDIAIEGEGFFQVTLPDGTTAYTRAGTFQTNQDGLLVTPDGFSLEPNITIPSDALSTVIGQDGTVNVTQPGSTAPTQVGQIQLVRFPNNVGLKSIGKNLLVETQASGSATTGNPSENGFGRLSQGYLETSNVSAVDEMIKLIVAQRAYEINSKAIHSADDTLAGAVNIKR